MREFIDELIDKWIMSLPNAAQAYRLEPVFHYQVEWIRTMMIVLDELMAEQGLDERTRRDIYRRLVLAGPDANSAMRRLKERQDSINEISRRGHPDYRPPWPMS